MASCWNASPRSRSACGPRAGPPSPGAAPSGRCEKREIAGPRCRGNCPGRCTVGIRPQQREVEGGLSWAPGGRTFRPCRHFVGSQPSPAGEAKPYVIQKRALGPCWPGNLRVDFSGTVATESQRKGCETSAVGARSRTPAAVRFTLAGARWSFFWASCKGILRIWPMSIDMSGNGQAR